VRVSDLKIPGKTTASGRSSSITNAFINAALPYVKLSEVQKLKILHFLEIEPENVECAYCGDVATEWDHFFPTIKDRKETGYFTEAGNLVPACGKCNQSKGNKDWLIWINSDAPLSPKSRGVKNLERRIRLLSDFASTFPAQKIDLSAVRHTNEWKQYESLMEDIIQKLKSADEMAKHLSKTIFLASGLPNETVDQTRIDLTSAEEN
jgi:hypothetical protein